jgi:hypothetical protein
MANSEKIYHIVYTSVATQPISSELIKSILNSARKHNAKDDITGFLVARDGHFLQLLEGPESAVKNCLKRISLDSRHDNVVLQAKMYSNERIMKDWSMAQVELKPTDSSSESLIELIEIAKSGKIYAQKSSIHVILKKFTVNSKIIE